METRIRLKDRILESIGNGSVKLILGMPGSGKSHFLSHDLFDALCKTGENEFAEVNASSFESVISLLKRKKEGKRLIVFADDVLSFPHLPSLFDSFAGRRDIDLVATSSFSPDYVLGEDETLLRGRYERFYFPPLPYEDSLELGLCANLDEYLAKGGLFLSKERSLEIALQEGRRFKRFRRDYLSKANCLMNLMAEHLDEPLSYLKISELSQGALSRPTLKSYLEFLEGGYLLLPLERENLLKGEIKSCERAYYLGDLSFQSEKSGRAGKEKSLLLTKLLAEGFSVRSGYVYGDFGDGFLAKDVAFVCERWRDRIYVSYSPEDGAKESEAMARLLRNSYQKIVVVPFNTNPWKDDAGIIHVGLQKFLLSEIREIIGG